MKKLLAILLAATMCVTLLAACGGQSNDTTDTNGDTAATDTKTDANADMIYAVETGSAGEAAAQEKGWEINSVAAQADALMEVEAGTSDAAIVDLLMATAMTGLNCGSMKNAARPATPMAHSTAMTTSSRACGLRPSKTRKKGSIHSSKTSRAIK